MYLRYSIMIIFVFNSHKGILIIGRVRLTLGHFVVLFDRETIITTKLTVPYPTLPYPTYLTLPCLPTLLYFTLTYPTLPTLHYPTVPTIPYLTLLYFIIPYPTLLYFTTPTLPHTTPTLPCLTYPTQPFTTQEWIRQL